MNNNINNPKSQVMAKKPFQQLLTRIRQSGYKVDKIPNGYTIVFEGETLLNAMNGYNGYLVRYNQKFLTQT